MTLKERGWVDLLRRDVDHPCDIEQCDDGGGGGGVDGVGRQDGGAVLAE